MVAWAEVEMEAAVEVSGRGRLTLIKRQMRCGLAKGCARDQGRIQESASVIGEEEANASSGRKIVFE
eukprot:2855428-Pleurochrysis_carterae.AAC.1